jgi:hypothetical protein
MWSEIKFNVSVEKRLNPPAQGETSPLVPVLGTLFGEDSIHVDTSLLTVPDFSPVCEEKKKITAIVANASTKKSIRFNRNF